MTHNFCWFDKKFYLQQKGVAMGAKFARSLANLFMSNWEREMIYDRQWNHLAFYKWFIDDFLIIWDGDFWLIEHFIETLNTNDRNIQWSFSFSTEQICFLDLSLVIREGQIYTKKHFLKQLIEIAISPYSVATIPFGYKTYQKGSSWGLDAIVELILHIMNRPNFWKIVSL